jgi:hypothetical protein
MLSVCIVIPPARSTSLAFSKAWRSLRTSSMASMTITERKRIFINTSNANTIVLTLEILTLPQQPPFKKHNTHKLITNH